MHDAISRLSTFNWERTRHLILTVNPSLFDGDGKRGWEEITFKRGVGNLLKNLERTEGIGIVDWISFVEWHVNGFPHWHVFIEVRDSGKAGMIGVVEIRRHWPWGIWIKEKPIESEKHWRSLIGYFDGHGYFEVGKGIQGKLPTWAKERNTRIKRYETKKLNWGLDRLGEGVNIGMGESDNVDGFKESRTQMRTYKVILENCGSECKIAVFNNSSTNSFKLPVRYEIMKYLRDWEYVEGRGLTQRMSKNEYDLMIESGMKLELITQTLIREFNDKASGVAPERSERATDHPLISEGQADQSYQRGKVPVLNGTELGILMGIVNSSTLRESVYDGA